MLDRINKKFADLPLVAGIDRAAMVAKFIKPTFPICHPNSWNSYHFPTAKGTVSPISPLTKSALDTSGLV